MRNLTLTLLCAAGCSLAAPTASELSGAATPRSDVAAWLATHRGGWCAKAPKQAVALCVSAAPRFSDPNQDGIFCFDDERSERAFLRRTYPSGVTLDVGFHFDGARNGAIVTFGSSDYLSYLCDPSIPGRRIEIGVDEAGRLFAAGPETPRVTARGALAKGTHLVEYRVTRERNALFVDGNPVGEASGTGGITVEFPERWAPGFVLGDQNQRWWVCGPGSPSRWLRMAGFFVHLRDDVDVGGFDLSRATEASSDTVLLFDRRGVFDNRWVPSAGVGVGPPADASTPLAGRSYGAVWSEDVWAGCLAR